MSLSVGEMRGYCYLMSATPHPLQVLVRSFLNFTDVLRMCIWFGPLSSTYFCSLFSTCELVPYANLGYNVYLFMIVTPPIFWKLRRCFVYGLKRAGGLGMILKLFSTRDLSLLAHKNYRVKKC